MDTYLVPCEPDPQQFDMCHLCSKLMMDLDGHKKVQTLFHDMEIIGQYASSNQKTLSISITTCALNLEVANRRTQKLCKYTKQKKCLLSLCVFLFAFLFVKKLLFGHQGVHLRFHLPEYHALQYSKAVCKMQYHYAALCTQSFPSRSKIDIDFLVYK